MPDIAFAAQRLGGLQLFRWDGSDPDRATVALANAIVDAGAPIYNHNGRLVTLSKTDEAVPIDSISMLRMIISGVLGKLVMRRRQASSGHRIGAGAIRTWHSSGEPFRFSANADLAREPNEAVLIKLFESVLLPLVPRLED